MPVRGDDVAGDDRRVGRDRPDLLDGPQRAGLVAVRRVDDEHVDAHREQRLRLRGRIAVDADRARDPQPALGVDGRAVDGAAQRALAGDAPEQPAVVVDDRRHREPLAAQAVVDLLRGGAGLERDELAAHHVLQLREPVEAGGVVLGEDADRPPSSSTTITAPCARLWIRPSASPTVWCGPSVIGVSYTV